MMRLLLDESPLLGRRPDENETIDKTIECIECFGG